MSTHKDHSHLEKIQDGIKESTLLTEDEKTQTIKHIEEWLLEDKAEGILYTELTELASGIKPILAELGLI